MLRIIFFLLTTFALVACGDKGGSSATTSGFSFASSVVGPADKLLNGCEGQQAPSKDSVCLRHGGISLILTFANALQADAANALLDDRLRSTGHHTPFGAYKNNVYIESRDNSPWILDLSGLDGLERIRLTTNDLVVLDVQKGKVVAYVSLHDYLVLMDIA